MNTRNREAEAGTDGTIVRHGPSLQRLAALLTNHIRRRIGERAFHFDGRLADPGLGLVPPLDLSLFRDQPFLLDNLRQPESGAALALNSFALWRRDPAGLELAGISGFREVLLNLRCPTGIRGTPPHLDVLARGRRALVAVSARGLDYLSRHTARVAPAYLELEPPAGLGPWLDLLRDLAARRLSYRFLNAAMLGKLALALGRTFPDHRIHLFQIFLEPRDADAFEPFARHRAELTALRERVRESRVSFSFDSFATLWRGWADRDEPPWLRQLVSQLEARYDIAVAARPAVGFPRAVAQR